MLVDSLKKEIVELRGTIHQLQAKVDFLLSFIGVTQPTATSSGTMSTSLAGGSQPGPTNDPNVDSSDAPDHLTGGSGSSGQVTFADIARRSRPPTLNPSLQQAVVSAVYSDLAEHDRRARNIIINGLSTADGGSDKQRVESLLNDEFATSVEVVRCRRIGRQQPARVQPLLAVLPSASDADYLIRNARRLRSSTNPTVRESVYINADLTKAEAHAAYQRRCRRRGMTAVHRNNSDNPNNPTDGVTGAETATAINAAAASTDTNTSSAGVPELQRQQISVRVSGIPDVSAGRPRQS